MAFTYCTNCGEKFDDSEQKCPHCGHRRGDPVSFSEEKGAFDQGQNYGQGVNGQQPRSGGYGSDYGNGNQENQNSGQGNGQKLWRTDDKNNPGGYIKAVMVRATTDKTATVKAIREATVVIRADITQTVTEAIRTVAITGKILPRRQDL